MEDMGNRRFWSRWAGVYDRFMQKDSRLYAQLAGRMEKCLKCDMRVLELACGTGMISERIAGMVRHLDATDFSPEMIAQANKKALPAHVHFSVQDATDLSYSDRCFDAVVIANALHIMPQPENALDEIHRVLKSGGLLIAPTFIHAQGLGFRMRTRLMELAGFRAYYKWNAEELIHFVSHRGFEIIEHEQMGSSIAPLCYLEARCV